MAVRTEQVSFGDTSGYLAVPERAAPPLPGVVVIQEIYGVNAHIEDVTRRIAAAGYLALAPDLYAVRGVRPPALEPARIDMTMAFMRRLPPGAMGDPAAREAELTRLPEIDRREIGETIAQTFGAAGPARMQAMVGPLRAAVRYLRHERTETREQKVGCVGFCMGGGLSALLACEEPELSAAIVFYGSAPPAEKVAAIRCPVLAFYGERDARVNATIPGFEQAMHAGGKSFEHAVYPDAAHAFFNDDGPAYEVRAARSSFARMLAFFLERLTG